MSDKEKSKSPPSPVRAEPSMSKPLGKKDSVLAKVSAAKPLHDDHSNTESQDLFNFLRQMHLTGGANGMTHHHLAQVTREGGLAGFSGEQLSSLVVSRKRKAWEGLHSGGSKGGPGRRDEEEDVEKEEEEEEEGEEEEGGRQWEEEEPDTHHAHLAQRRPSHHGLLSPLNNHFGTEEDIDADNLAADFDESFTGLGVDINTTNYSMSEAMLSLNNIAHHIKSSPDRPSVPNSYGALDLSNDEAQHACQQEEGAHTPPLQGEPPSFSGSVSRDNSREASGNGLKRETILRNTKEEVKSVSPEAGGGKISTSVITSFKSLQGEAGEELRLGTKHELPPTPEYGKSMLGLGELELEDDSRFQYILAAPTSVATKYGEPSLTYINQGQSYEIKIKKLGDLSGHYRKKWLRSTIRICFHERRLQYIEAEQISEWSRTHPNERILEIDTPLSYGMADVKQGALNSVSFLWDPTRDTGIFVKVHCISTEFTPKKHGGERGVPFRLQVETYSNDDTRLHAASCILQVFKLKGADRKHKQDREKLAKRPDSEREKFCPQYDCTMLSDLSVDSIYIPATMSPAQSEPDLANIGKPLLPPPSLPAGPPLKSVSLPSSREVSPLGKQPLPPPPPPANLPSPLLQASAGADRKVWRVLLAHTADTEATASWLTYNRYGQHVKTFSEYDARDLLRLARDDLVQMVGLVDGVRLYNDLHMRPMAPRLMLYLAQRGESLFSPVMLLEVTVAELISNVAEMLQVPVGLFNKVIVLGPKKIHIKLTDEFLRYQRPETAFQYSLVHDEGEACTIQLEPVPE